MIEVRNLTKHFDRVTAVDQLSFKVEEGQNLALIGTSGCGKTTTLKMINRLIEPSQGQVLVNDIDVLHQPKESMRRQIGYVIQDIGLFPHYTVEENIGVVPRLLKWEASRLRERTYSLMEKLGLAPETYAGKYPEQLSGGQQQRVGIARALAASPPIVLMDEPFGALDPMTRRDIRREFKKLEELASKTTIIVTHDVEEAFEMGDLICLLDKGQVQQIGSPRSLLFRPANEFVVNFLAGQKLQLEFEVVRLRDLFAYLPVEPDLPESKIVPLKPEDTVLSAMAKLVRESHRRTAGEVRFNGDIRRFDLPLLMDVFYDKIIME